MSRKDTVWGARHRLEEEEIDRIIESFNKVLNMDITKLEASAILAERSHKVKLTDKEALEILKRLRGF